MKKINIPLFKVFMSPNAPEKVKQVLESGFIGEGEQVKLFEKNLKKYIGCKNLVTTNSATSALHLTLHLLKNNIHGHKKYNWPFVKEGDEVLSCPLTCTATNWPVLANNLNLKWVDVDRDTCNMCLSDLKNKISSKTKIIILVHWGGNPIDLKKIEEIKEYSEKKYGFRPIIIEDSAHAFGSEYKGQILSSIDNDNIKVHSFQAIKHITSIDGGCIIFPDNTLTKQAKLLRWYGIDRDDNTKDFRCENNISEWGFKFHMNDVCATVGIENLKYVNKLLKINRRNADYYIKKLRNNPDITLLKVDKNNNPSYWIYTIKVKNQTRFMEKMNKNNIMVSRVHERNDKHSCAFKYNTKLPNLDKIVNEMICLPVGWWLSKKEIKQIVKVINDGW